MTVIRPNSISGVSSITAQGGNINVHRADGTVGDLTINNIVGVAATFTGNLGVGGVLTYEDVTNVDSVGVITARDGIRCTGIVTATSFHGDGSSLTGVGASFGNSSINTSGIVTATAFVPTTGQLSHRNIIINGAMTVSQRGTSESGITGAKFANAPDRFKIEGGSYGTITASQSTDSPNGFANSFKVDVTTANGSLSASSYLELVHKLEGFDVQSFAKGTSDAKQFALSFHVKTTKTGTYVVLVIDHDNSRMVSKTYTVSDTNWNKYELFFPADTTGAFGNDNNLSLSIKFVLVAGTTFASSSLQTTWGAVSNGPSRTGQVNFADSTSNDWYLTGVQLEVGPVTTPFEHRSHGEELSRCQRYCVVDIAEKYWYNGHGGNVRDYSYYSWPTTMRAAPTITFGTPITETLLNTSGGAGHQARKITTSSWQYGPRASQTGNAYGEIPYTASAEL